MKFKKLESGRSMVEMLGVLAIIGVLSVGGIAGYSLSMRRHRANGVVDAVTTYAALNYGKCQQKIMNGELGTLSSSGTFDTSNGCQSTLFPNFPDTDLGQLPSGVKEINHGMVEMGPSGVDKVSTYVVLSDQKLCQAVASITGGSCEQRAPGEHLIVVTINQN